MSHTASLPVAVVGCGRMGRLHIKTYAAMPDVQLVGVADANAPAALAVAQEYKTQARPVAELLSLAKAVTIAVPTEHHLAAAEPFLRRGIPCLIEKPLAPDVASAQRICDLAREFGALVQVGHIERFNPAVRALERLDIRPRFIECTRVSPLTFRSLDVGVVLDMMIHDLDIVLKLANSAVLRVESVGASVVATAEDVCNARITFASGCVANVTASRLSLTTARKLRVFSTDAFVSLDYQKRTGVVARRGENLDRLRQTVSRVRAGDIADLAQISYAGLVNVEQLVVENVDQLRAQADAFIAAVRSGGPSPVPPEAGLAAVDLAHRIVAGLPLDARL